MKSGLVLYLVYHSSFFPFAQFCTTEFTGASYPNVSTWTLRVKGVTARVKLTVKLVTKWMHEQTLARTDCKILACLQLDNCTQKRLKIMLLLFRAVVKLDNYLFIEDT